MTRFDHVGVAVRDIASAGAFLAEHWGFSADDPVDLPERGSRVQFLNAAGVRIELVQPVRPDARVAARLAEFGEGLYHICLGVDDVDRELARLGAAGVRLVDTTPWVGPHGRFAYLEPSAWCGVAIELLQRWNDEPR